MRAAGGPPCQDAAGCRALLVRLQQAKKEACGDKPTCEATADLEKEIRSAVLVTFRKPCEAGDPRACIDAYEFGYEDGLRAACDFGHGPGCMAACMQAPGLDGEACRGLARNLKVLLSECRFKRPDQAESCRKLGELVTKVSVQDPSHPPHIGPETVLYATPLLDDRPRSRYALDYFSRACHLGDPLACAALCRGHANPDSPVSARECRTIVHDATAKSLWQDCRSRNGAACHDLARLCSRMGFFDRDPAGFFVSGPGRVVGLEARACHLGFEEACGQSNEI